MNDDFDFVAHIKRAARDALNGLTDPDDDILPVILSNGPHGLSVTGALMPADEEGKAALADQITARVAVAQATEAAMVCPAYLRTINPDTGELGERVEHVVLVHCYLDGQSAWSAKVTRHEDRPPDMSIWEDWGTAAVVGRFADAMHAGLAYAKTSHDDPDMQEILDAGHREGQVDRLVELFLAAKAGLKESSNVNTEDAR